MGVWLVRKVGEGLLSVGSEVGFADVDVLCRLSMYLCCRVSVCLNNACQLGGFNLLIYLSQDPSMVNLSRLKA